MAPRFDSPPSGSPSYSKPRPRPGKSPAQSAQIRVQNRRREYLERHPEYFESLDHELAAPLLYDHLVRRFQSAAEREAEGRAKGYGRILEGSLARDEERRERDKAARAVVLPEATPSGRSGASSRGLTEAMSLECASAAPSFALDEELVPPPQTKEEGAGRWRAFLGDRFVRGGDGEFDYAARVDENDDYDAMERREQEDAWYDDEAAAWSETSEEPNRNGQRMEVDKVLIGETGIQDF